LPYDTSAPHPIKNGIANKTDTPLLDSDPEKPIIDANNVIA